MIFIWLALCTLIHLKPFIFSVCVRVCVCMYVWFTRKRSRFACDFAVCTQLFSSKCLNNPYMENLNLELYKRKMWLNELYFIY